MNEDQVRNIIKDELRQSQYKLSNIPYHTHNGIDSFFIPSSSSSVSINASGPGTSTTVPGSLSPTAIPISSATFANGITYDSTNKRFKIATAGQYMIVGFVYYSNPTTANVTYQTMVYKNGSSTFATYVVPPVTSITVGVPAINILDCAVNDYIELFAQTNAAGNNIVSGALSFLSLAKV